MVDVRELFDLFEEDEHRFEDVTEKSSTRSDLCAMLILDRLLPGNRDIICSAEHDMIYFNVDLEDLGNVATVTDIHNLVRCGLMCDGDGLSTFV